MAVKVAYKVVGEQVQKSLNKTMDCLMSTKFNAIRLGPEIMKIKALFWDSLKALKRYRFNIVIQKGAIYEIR